MIYFDNAATTRLDTDAFEAMKPYLLCDFGNASQPYSFSRKPKKALKKAREIIAKCINAFPEEIYFTSCGTESDNWALKGYYLSQNGKDVRIITSSIEHHAVLNCCKTIEKLGGRVDYLPVNSNGEIDTLSLEEIVSQNSLVSIMFVNNEIGSIQNIKDLCSIAHKNNCIFHTDAVQAIGHLRIDVKDLGVDMLSASAHKFNGPKGIGFLYINKNMNLPSFIDGGSQEFGKRAGTENIASIVGMAAALKKNCELLEENTTRIKKMERLLMDRLYSSGLDFRRNGSGNGIPGNISLSFRGIDGELLLHRLDLMGYSVSTGSACDGKKNQISHVIKAIGVNKEYAKGTIRISLSKDNTEEEISLFCNDIEQLVKTLVK